MVKCNGAKIPLAVRNLDPMKDIYGPTRDREETLSERTPYLAAIGGLLYLANSIRPDISFAVSLPARYSHEPTNRH